MTSLRELQPQRFRTIWISDVHLGSKMCRADYLLGFLHATECETLYLVGDIVDLWHMRSGIYWPQEHNDVIRTLLTKAQHGTRIIYVPGNHADLLRDYAGMTFGNITVEREAIHTTAAGWRCTVTSSTAWSNAASCWRSSAVMPTTGCSGATGW